MSLLYLLDRRTHPLNPPLISIPTREQKERFMSGLNWSKLPGLITAVFLHVVGVFFLVKATNLDCNAIGRAAALQRQLEGSDYRYDPSIREREGKCNQNMSIDIWSSMGCWFLSFGGLAHTIVLLQRRNKRQVGGATIMNHSPE